MSGKPGSSGVARGAVKKDQGKKDKEKSKNALSLFFGTDSSETLPSLKMGKYIMQATCSFPIHRDQRYQDLQTIHVCELCLDFFLSSGDLQKHKKNCQDRCPPGIKIYEKSELSIFQVDGDESIRYCSNLCMLAKYFLPMKIRLSELSPFFFYVMTENDEDGSHLIGYFSKGKRAASVNLCCIVVLPPYQKKGYGGLLIDLSYKLSKREGMWGTPERPFSKLGEAAYHKYWKKTLLKEITEKPFSVYELSIKTAISPKDILDILEPMNLVEIQRESKDFSVGKSYETMFNYKKMLIKKIDMKNCVPEIKYNSDVIDEACLKWQPHFSDCSK